MADGSCNNGDENDVVELEAMCKDRFSWHPCQVSLCSKGLGLIVQYGDGYKEETIADKQEILARIRVRSTPLQGDDCSSLQQGDHVLAAQNSHVQDVYYDAQLEEANRVRHSKRAHCRCSFRIRWLQQALEKEALTVPASAIMKLATKSINVHPTISTLFSMLESSNGLDTLPGATIVDSMDWEMDISVLLEKQIKEISNSTGVAEEKTWKNMVFGVEVDFKGQTKGASLKNPRENKKRVESGNEIRPSIQEVLTGSRSPLNPLAARAALASLRSNLPKSNVDEGKLLNGNSLKIDGIVKTLFPTSSDPRPRGRKNALETRLTRSQIQTNRKGQVEVGDNVELEENHNIPKRRTRSGADPKDKVQPNKKSNSCYEVEGNVSVESNTAEKQQESDVGHSKSTKRNKYATTQHQERRFSPRLRQTDKAA